MPCSGTDRVAVLRAMTVDQTQFCADVADRWPDGCTRRAETLTPLPIVVVVAGVVAALEPSDACSVIAGEDSAVVEAGEAPRHGGSRYRSGPGPWAGRGGRCRCCTSPHNKGWPARHRRVAPLVAGRLLGVVTAVAWRTWQASPSASSSTTSRGPSPGRPQPTGSG